MRNFAVSFGFLFLFLVTFWPNHHHRLLSIHLRCITAFTSSVKPQLLFRGQPAAAGSGWKFRRRTLGSHRNQRCLPVSGLPASSQTQTAPGEANSASRRSQMCSGWCWTSAFFVFSVPPSTARFSRAAELPALSGEDFDLWPGRSAAGGRRAVQHGGGNRLDERSQRRRRRGGRSRLAPVQPQHSCRLQGENGDSDWSVCLLETRTLLLILH